VPGRFVRDDEVFSEWDVRGIETTHVSEARRGAPGMRISISQLNAVDLCLIEYAIDHELF
jgi:hypothetical protein